MKPILFFLLLISSVHAFSQGTPDDQLFTTSFKTSGYIDGIRLDSLDAAYAILTFNNSSLFFNYGQQINGKRDYKVTDNKGKPLNFVNNELAFSLNFLYFNGWELDQVEENFTQTYILKKRLGK
jgi:hypothetical protein